LPKKKGASRAFALCSVAITDASANKDAGTILKKLEKRVEQPLTTPRAAKRADDTQRSSPTGGSPSIARSLEAVDDILGNGQKGSPNLWGGRTALGKEGSWGKKASEEKRVYADCRLMGRRSYLVQGTNL